MVDFSVFDSILDAAFVIDHDGRIVYCNEPAARFCDVSVRRVTGKAIISDLFKVETPGLLPFTATSPGFGEPTSFIETKFNVIKSGHGGTCQLAVRPVGNGHWLFFVRDVSLEEALHGKYRSELAQKEDYARNLEKLVEARTAELRQVNQTLNAILNSLGQGFFTFNGAGRCGPVFTKACETVLEGSPQARVVTDVLAIPDDEREQFAKWSEGIFQEYLPFEDMRGLGPSNYAHSKGQHVTLEYYPLRGDDQSVSEVVVVATDRSAEVEAQRALEIERQFAAMIVKYTKNKDQFLRFLSTVGPAFTHLIARAQGALSKEDINEAFRTLHTLEGEAGTFSVRDLRVSTRECQQILEAARAGAPYDEVTRARFVAALTTAAAGFAAFLNDNKDVIQVPTGEVSRSLEVPVEHVNALLAELGNLPGGSKAAAKYSELLLAEPIEKHLRYFDGLMSAVADKLGKRVHPLRIVGGQARIFPEAYDGVFASLVHAFRNAVDHGLEMPDDREWAGKDPAGTITAEVTLTPDSLLLNISDDGRGIDPNVIREKLKEKFPNEDAAALSDEDVIQAVCRPGFSSRDAVGEFSGRGVGLDALREETLRLGGTLHVKSKQGEGTAIQIALPRICRTTPALRSA